MKKYLTLLCGLAGGPAMAQIQVTAADLPVLSDTIRYSTSASIVSSSLLTQSGANQSWDFSFLTPTSQDIAAYKSAAQINIAYMLNFATSSYGRKDADQAIGAFQATDVYNFYKKSTSQFILDGRGLSMNGLPIPQTYSSKDIIYKLPLNYGNKDSCTYAASEMNLSIASVSGSGKRVNEVDAWGTVITPYGSFSCLRIKSVVRHTDTIKTQLGTIPFTRNYTEYKWIAKGQKIPVLEITVTSGPASQTTIKYRDIYRAGLFEGKARFTANKTNALKGDTVSFNDLSSFTPAEPVAWQWTITPSTFQFVGGTDATTQNPKVIFNASGLYTVKLKTSYAAGSDDTTYTDYINVSAPSSIQDLQNAGDLQVYPNPSNGLLNIRLALHEATNARLTDLQGKLLLEIRLQPGLNQVDVSALPAGMYLLCTQGIQHKILLSR